MSRSEKKFKSTKGNFHLMDNDLLKPGDKLGKIGPIYDKQKFNSVWFVSQPA